MKSEHFLLICAAVFISRVVTPLVCFMLALFTLTACCVLGIIEALS